MTGRPPWTTKWGEDGFRYQLLITRARAVLAAAFAAQRYTLHPWLAYDWEPVLDAVNRVFSLFLQAKYMATQPEGSSPPLPALKVTGQYNELPDRGAPVFAFSRLFPNDDWRSQSSMVFDSRVQPSLSFSVSVQDWRHDIPVKEDVNLHLNLYSSGERHQPPSEVWEFLEQEISIQLEMPILPATAFPRDDIPRLFTVTPRERLWDLRIRFTDFLRRFLTCYRADLHPSGRLMPDPFTVFFVRPRSHIGAEDTCHTRSGLFGHTYVIDEGQQLYLAAQRLEDQHLPTDALDAEYLRFPDGLCTSVFLSARSSESTRIGLIIDDYGPIGNNGQLKLLEQTLLKKRTLMEVPIYEDLPLLAQTRTDGPSLILCVAIPEADGSEQSSEMHPPAKYASLLTPPGFSNYRLAEEQMVREIAHKMTRSFLSVATVHDISNIVAISPTMLRIKHEVGRIASKDSPLLILGESGTGKSSLAENVHASSKRAHKKLVRVERVPDDLFYAEVFGAKKGAYTGSDKDKIGKAVLADGGTLFLDDVDKLSLKAQGDLLNLLDGKAFTPLGETKEIKVNVRIIVATNASIEDLVHADRFREDLYYRLLANSITLPPLRDRTEDIPIWAEKFLDEISFNNGSRSALTSAAVEKLKEHRWRRNLRGLMDVLDNAADLAPGGEIGPEHLDFEKDDPTNQQAPALDTVSRGVADAIRNLPGETNEDKLQLVRLILRAAGRKQ